MNYIFYSKDLFYTPKYYTSILDFIKNDDYILGAIDDRKKDSTIQQIKDNIQENSNWLWNICKIHDNDFTIVGKKELIEVVEKNKDEVSKLKFPSYDHKF